MESFFNEAVASRLQYLTFPLEVCGIALALIELRFPETAAKLTQHIERFATPLDPAKAVEGESPIEASLAVFLPRLLRAGTYALTAVYALRLLYGLITRWPDTGWLPGFLLGYVIWSVIVVVLLIVLGIITFFMVVGGSAFVQRFVAGRAVGTLGLLIAGLGLLGELYQFVTQLTN